jgi:hypothetical protein
MPSAFFSQSNVDEIVFWLICAIAAAGVWWAFFGGAFTRHRNEHTDYVGKGPGLLVRNQGLPRPCGPMKVLLSGTTLKSYCCPAFHIQVARRAPRGLWPPEMAALVGQRTDRVAIAQSEQFACWRFP